MVRGVGAAGASLELKVEEHASGSAVRGAKLPVAQPAHDTGDSADSDVSLGRDIQVDRDEALRRQRAVMPCMRLTRIY